MSRPKAVIKSVRVVGYVHPDVLAAIGRRAKRDGLSVASVVAEVLTLNVKWRP